MLGVGWTEMLVIGVVALIVIGPKELPGLMRKLGQFTSTIRRMGSDFQRELNKTTGLDEVKNLRTAITQPLKATTDAIRKEFNSMGPSGTVQPSGVLKPADPKAESVVKEIHAAAGIEPPKPAEPIKAAPVMTATTPTPTEPIKAAPVKAAAVSVVTPSTAAPPAPVPDVPAPKPRRAATKAAAPAPAATAGETNDLFASEKPARKRAAKKAPVESPAPVEAIAPAADKPKRQPAAKKTAKTA